jgi:hypothetical protein
MKRERERERERERLIGIKFEGIVYLQRERDRGTMKAS